MEWQRVTTGRFGASVSLDGDRKWVDKVIVLYLLFTILLIADRWFNGMLLSQLFPPFFVTPLNLSTWGVMYTGVHQLFIKYPAVCLIADLLLLFLPLSYGALHFMGYQRIKVAVGWIILVFNFVYAQCYAVFPSNSIEGHIGWILFPLVLTSSNLFNYKVSLQFIRYFFLFFFASAGIWKLRNGGVFNIEQMSGILLYQHTTLLVTSPGSFLARLYYWLAQHTIVGYLFYAAATLLELFFIVGFFTYRYDRLLIILFFIFLLGDIVLMQIKYWEVIYLVIPLFFSKRLRGS